MNPNPDPEALQLVTRFQDALRRRDLDEARRLAPGVEISTEGWPYEDETGPLNPDAFGDDPRVHRVMAYERLGDDRFVFQTGIAVFEIERRGGRLVISDGYLKPIE